MRGSIRQGQLRDIADVAALGLAAIDEGVWGPDLVGEEAEIYATLVEQTRHNLVYVACVDGRVVGATVLRMQRWPWSQNVVYIQSLLLYVHPAYRATRAETGKPLASALIDTCIDLSNRSGYQLIVDVMWGDDATIEKRDEYMRRSSGLKYIGGTFSHVPQRLKVNAAE